MGEGRVALISGGGALPEEAAAALFDQGLAPALFGFEGLTDPALLDRGDRLRLGQVEALSAALSARGVTRVLIVGRFDPSVLGDDSSLLEPDPTALALIARLEGQSLVRWMGEIADWLESRGFALLRQDQALRSLLLCEGALTRRPPDGARLRDLAAGRAALAESSPESLMQAVVVSMGRVIAFEEEDGTDEMIRRAGTEVGPGFTVVKGGRPGQDPRLDLPAIGPGTLSALRAAGAGALAVEAGSTLVVDRSGLVAAADEAGLCIWAYGAGEI